jgi:uncharacterized protein (DUF779 family)
MKHPAAKGCTDDGTLAIVPMYIYPSCTDILAYYTDIITDVRGGRGGGCAVRRPKQPWVAEWGSAVLPRPACGLCARR